MSTTELPTDRAFAQINNVLDAVEKFYTHNPQIKESHGISHAMAVYHHAVQAVDCHLPKLTDVQARDVLAAALLHDVDDKKYFPENVNYRNAKRILLAADIVCQEQVLYMISLISCSTHGNSVPNHIVQQNAFYMLIPRWADRLEAVGPIGVVRCYQYTKETNQPLSCRKESPRAKSREEVWELATNQRFEEYTHRKASTDMISHYYDKLLHVARPPRNIVRNQYLEHMGKQSSNELVEVCLRFGRTGVVDEEYIQGLVARLPCA